MDKSLQLGSLNLQISADKILESHEHLLLTGSRIAINLPSTPVRYLRHGWQSWSLAAWTDPSPLPVQRPAILHPLQTDPVYVKERLPHGSWFGAVEFQDGQMLLLGALGLETHVRLNGNRLEGWSETGGADWVVAFGEEGPVFSKYAGLLGEIFGRAGTNPSPRVWCSWYSLYSSIDETILFNVFKALDGLPFDVVQIDDGWQRAIGDWEPNGKFHSGMSALSKRIRSGGRTAGLWLAPLIAVKSSRLFHEHREWFLKDEQGGLVSAGFNWGEQLYALDTTHPAVLNWLVSLMRQAREWGFDFLKLDFLYGGALPGRRFVETPREAAYRQSLKVLRTAMGEDAYFLACGAPIFPSLGLCDAIRVGPDMSNFWESQRDAVLLSNPTTPGTRNGIRTSLHRLWLSPLVQPDPDVALFASRGNSLSAQQRHAKEDLALICDFRATSDLPEWLSAEELSSLRRFLEASPASPRQTARYTYALGTRIVDFSEAIPLPEPAKGWASLQGALVAWLGERPWALRIMDKLNRHSAENSKRDLLLR